MKELFEHLGLETYEELKELSLHPIGREDFWPEEIEDWMRELPDFEEPIYNDEEEEEFGGEEEFGDITEHVLDDDKSKEITILLVDGKIRRDEAIAQLAIDNMITKEEVNKILKELDL